MSFYPHKEWSNRTETKTKRLPTIKGRTWTRRIRWLEAADESGVKLKLEDGIEYKEVLVSRLDADKVYARFIEGQSINDALSILARPVPKSMQSKRASEAAHEAAQADAEATP